MRPGAHRAPDGESGFTVVEVLVAMVVLTVGILGVLGALISSGNLTLGSQVHEAAIGFAEQQIETLRQQPFASLGMQAAPSHSNTANDPNFYTNGDTGTPKDCYVIQANYYDTTINYAAGGNSIGCESFVTPGTGGPAATVATVPATPQPIPAGYQGLSGTFDVYVTSHTNNGCVTISSSSICLTGAQKRITVAVWPASLPGTGSRRPIWVTSIIGDPNTPVLPLP